jgi:hypothetical protein
MNAIEKLNALQAEIEAFAVDTRAGVYRHHPNDWNAQNDKIQAAKVEASKVVVNEARMLLADNQGRSHSDLIVAVRKALTLLKQLKESL